MLNVLAYLVGLLSLVIVIPAQLPLLGALSSKDGGRNFCLVVLLIAVVRLMLGGGIF